MSKFIDITGQKFHRMRVIKFSGHYMGTGYVWECICDCGIVKKVKSCHLRAGNVKSCGCYRDEVISRLNKGVSPVTKLPYGVAALNAVISGYRSKARERNLVWELTDDVAGSLLQGDCFYCGTQPTRLRGCKTANGKCVCNGIDRIDSSRGYIDGNVVTACADCNRAKLAMPQMEFIALAERIYRKQMYDITLPATRFYGGC